MTMRRYKGDPYWIKARFAGDCGDCGTEFKKGADVFYYPRGKGTYPAACGCGHKRAREFEAAALDESMLGG